MALCCGRESLSGILKSEWRVIFLLIETELWDSGSNPVKTQPSATASLDCGGNVHMDAVVGSAHIVKHSRAYQRTRSLYCGLVSRNEISEVFGYSGKWWYMAAYWEEGNYTNIGVLRCWILWQPIVNGWTSTEWSSPLLKANNSSQGDGKTSSYESFLPPPSIQISQSGEIFISLPSNRIILNTYYNVETWWLASWGIQIISLFP